MPDIDLNGDGRSDIILRDFVSGVVDRWLGQADGGFSISEYGSDPYAPGVLFGVGDVDADGRSDTVWRNANGDVYLSLTYPDGAFYFQWSSGFVARVDSSWTIAGMGDFNGDGRDDILWRHTSGIVTDWLSNGGYVFTNNHANTGQGVPTDWQIAGTGDFNGDGRDDILWRHSSGMVTTWLGQINGGFVNNHSSSAQQVPIDWQIVGVGDFNGDGRDDILWRHSSGLVTDWLGQSNGGFVNNHANSARPSTENWNVWGTGDYNGDGRHDILWRTANGSVTDWLGQTNGSFADNVSIANYPLPFNWSIEPNPAGVGAWDYY